MRQFFQMDKQYFRILNAEQIQRELLTNVEDLSYLALRYKQDPNSILAPDSNIELSHWNIAITERLLERACEIISIYISELIKESNWLYESRNVWPVEKLSLWVFSVAQNLRNKINLDLFGRICAIFMTIRFITINYKFELPTFIDQMAQEISLGVDAQRTRIVICYAERDRRWLERLQIHLKPLQMQDLIDPWDNTRILPGQLYRDEVERALSTARAVILLVSADLLASGSIIGNELPSILYRHEKAGAAVLPLILRPCLFRQSPLKEFQAFNSPPELPLTSLKRVEREALLVRVAETVANMLTPPRPRTRYSSDTIPPSV